MMLRVIEVEKGCELHPHLLINVDNTAKAKLFSLYCLHQTSGSSSQSRLISCCPNQASEILLNPIRSKSSKLSSAPVRSWVSCAVGDAVDVVASSEPGGSVARVFAMTGQCLRQERRD